MKSILHQKMAQHCPTWSRACQIWSRAKKTEEPPKPIRYTYDCYNWDGADFIETYADPLQLKVMKDSKQNSPTESPYVFEISTKIEVGMPRDGKPTETELPSLKFMKVKEINKAKMIIYSLPLIDAIREVVKYYPSQNLIGDEVTIHEPYRVLIHHFQELKDLRARLDTESAASSDAPLSQKCHDLDVLLDFLNPKVQRLVPSADKRLLKETPTVTFDEIWYMLKPGTLSYFLNDDTWVGGAIESVQLREKADELQEAWQVNILFQDNSLHSQVLGRIPHQLIIEAFDGEKVVTTLPIFPRQFHDSKDNNKRRHAFEKRGALVRDIVWEGHMYMKYSGRLMGKEKKRYDGPVIIGPCDLQVDFPSNNWSFDWLENNNKSFKIEDDPNPITRVLPVELTASESSKSQLSDEHLFMQCPVMPAFALLTKTWEFVNVDYATHLEDAAPIPDANIKPEHLQIIKALSDCQISSQNPWSADFIKDKGEGVVVLLHGPPGVGKTYTVESIAMNTGRPLISLTIGDLGTKEESIENQLTSWFSLAQKWRAILLLDEADIFLERREHKDIARNGIVSAFLRKMEFFKGLLFLTTNRIGHIDEAFISRVHVIIGFEKLDPQRRRMIWKSFLDKLHQEQKGKIRVTPACAHFIMGDEMSSMEWNGREIRNAFQTAIALAEYDIRGSEYHQDGDEITVESDHFKKVMDMSRSFRQYMDSIRADSEAARARTFYGRNDYFGREDAATSTGPSNAR